MRAAFAFLSFPLFFFLTQQGPAVAQVRYHALTISDSIGSTASEPSSGAVLLSNPVGVEVDTGHNIHILDAGTHSIYIFNTQGELVKTGGRRGSGPLEFIFGDAANAGLLKRDQQSNLFVYSLTSFTGQLINNTLTIHALFSIAIYIVYFVVRAG